ncbi:FcoT family thioesterase [Aliikangiella maris]|uniref:(2E)-enoyl-[ACP] glycyltransferase n=2 Tax=Aliikangiella maris TaxID=3162458 RepID=A0ABV2BRR3_9GAMM
MIVSESLREQIKFNDDPDLMAKVLTPYKDHCQYLKIATVTSEGNRENEEYLASSAMFQIPESCYIDDTGHFNSVEFNICYNQLMYYTIAKSIAENASPMFADWTMEKYWQKQLPDILIINFKSNFKRPINASRFSGEMEFIKTTFKKNIQFVNTIIRYWDDNNGYCEGAVDLAIVNM